MGQTIDDVVLVDEHGRPIGRHDRQSVHSTNTPRHLAFSCWVIARDQSVLITRRALQKRTWPGVWTNACCGHPRPGEPMEDAVRRRIGEELGLIVDQVECLLPDFSYRATDAGGMVENEFCPVYRTTIVEPSAVTVDPTEVAELSWEQPAVLVTAIRTAPYAFSPWSVRQLAQLGEYGLAGRKRVG